jgi:hypothetical protein
MRFSLLCLFSFSLAYLAYVRTDFFSPSSIAVELSSHPAEEPSKEIEEALMQPYHYLGKGRQCYVFVSQDEKNVIKFFNKKYLTVPWYGRFLKGERAKRERRQKYYREGYPLASQKDSEILYLHFSSSKKQLPLLSILDRASRLFTIDLNKVPFVLQKKGEPFYPALQSFYRQMGKEGLEEAIEQFIALIGRRISQKIADADHDVEHNFAILSGNVFQLDPGRLFFTEDLWEPDRLIQEWWGATHRFRKWLLENYPESVPFLDAAIERRMASVSF